MPLAETKAYVQVLEHRLNAAHNHMDSQQREIAFLKDELCRQQQRSRQQHARQWEGPAAPRVR
jgi:hypothetical protein